VEVATKDLITGQQQQQQPSTLHTLRTAATAAGNCCSYSEHGMQLLQCVSPRFGAMPPSAVTYLLAAAWVCFSVSPVMLVCCSMCRQALSFW